MAKERIAIWDNLKGILIFLVVLGHFADLYTGQSKDLRSLFLFIYSFHMPLFIFISGLFSKRAVREKDWKKVFEYFAMYIWVKVILLIAKFVCTGEMIATTLFTEYGIPWFMFALAAYYAITILLQDLDKRYLLIFSIVLACVAGYDASISAFLVISRIIVFYPFFLMGYYLSPDKVINTVKNKISGFFSVIAILVFAVISLKCVDDIYWIRPLLTGQNPFTTLGEYYQYGGLLRILYYPVVFLLMYALIVITPRKKCIISKIGSKSLQIYILHYIFVYILIELLHVDKLLMHIIPNIGYWWVIVVAVLTTLLCSMNMWTIVLKPIIEPKWESNR